MTGGRGPGYGPDLPSESDLWAARDAARLAADAGCTIAEWAELAIASQQTTAAYLSRADAVPPRVIGAQDLEAEDGCSTFDDALARWGLLPRGPSAIYAKWLAEGEPEAGT